MTSPPDPVTAVTSRNPHESYKRLRAQGAFFWFEARQSWLATEPTSARAILADPGLEVRPPGEIVPSALAGTTIGDVFGKLVRMTDGERHRLAKTATQRALDTVDLTWVRVECARQVMASDGIAMSEIAFTIPVRVIGRLLGVQARRVERLPALVRDLARCIGPGASRDAISLGVAAVDEIASWFADPPAGPLAPDLLERLRQTFAGVGITEPDAVIANAIGLLVQAHDATAGLLGSSLLRLAHLTPVPTDPDEIEAIVRTVLIEDAPIQNKRRFASADTLIHGQPVRADDQILVVLASAAGDPSPVGEVRVDGLPLGFGRHACPGGELAIAIVTATISTLVARDGAGFLSADVAYLPSVNARVPLLDRAMPHPPACPGGRSR